MNKGLKIFLGLLVAGVLLLPLAIYGAYQYHDCKNAKLVALAGSKKHVNEVTAVFGKPYHEYTDDRPPSGYLLSTFGFDLDEEEYAYQFYPTSKFRPCYMIFVITDRSGTIRRAVGYQP